MVIRDCTFDTGDDCIAIKSGRNADGRRVNVPSERILVEDCDFRAGHGGVTVGSEMSGGVRDVFARNLRMSSPDLDIALRFKTNSVRGGFIHDFHARDITVGTVAQSAIVIDFYYEEGPGHGFNPDVARHHRREPHGGHRGARALAARLPGRADPRRSAVHRGLQDHRAAQRHRERRRPDAE